MFEWREEYSLGIISIDNQHKKIFVIANEIYQLLNNDLSDSEKYDRVIKLIGDLKAYTIYHFGWEESYMESIGYKDLNFHKLEHNCFIKKIDGFNLGKDTNWNSEISTLINFIDNWINEHILHSDRAYVNL